MGCPIEKFRVKLNSFFCGVVAILGVPILVFGAGRAGITGGVVYNSP